MRCEVPRRGIKVADQRDLDIRVARNCLAKHPSPEPRWADAALHKATMGKTLKTVGGICLDHLFSHDCSERQRNDCTYGGVKNVREALRARSERWPMGALP